MGRRAASYDHGLEAHIRYGRPRSLWSSQDALRPPHQGCSQVRPHKGTSREYSCNTVNPKDYIPVTITAPSPTIASFVKAFTAKYGEEPDVFAAHAYDALKSMAVAITAGEMAHPDAVKLQLLNLDFDGPAGHTAFDERGDVTRYPQMFVLQQGKPILYEKFEKEGGRLPIPGS